MWVDEQRAKEYRQGVKSMNEEDWDYHKRYKAVLRISDYWINKGEDPKIVDEWDLAFKYEDWKYGNF